MRSRFIAPLMATVAFGLVGTARAQNVIPDPAFKAGVAAWTPRFAGDATFSFVSDFSKRPGSGSALLAGGGKAGGGFAVCLPVLEARPYDWGYSCLFPDAARSTGVSELVQFHAGPGCSGAIVGGRALLIYPGVTNLWFDMPPARFTMPQGSSSVLLGFDVVGGAQALAYLDDVFFAPAGTVPPIEPAPQNVPALSAPGLLALAGALALAAVHALRA
jgi:hypothetical protein